MVEIEVGEGVCCKGGTEDKERPTAVGRVSLYER